MHCTYSVSSITTRRAPRLSIMMPDAMGLESSCLVVKMDDEYVVSFLEICAARIVPRLFNI